MGLSGKYAMRDNGYWLPADGVRGAAHMTYIYSIQKIHKFRSLTKEPNLKREVVMMYTQNDILLSV